MGSTGFKEGLPPIPDNVSFITGPGYLGILLNSWLFGVLTLQYYLYYVNFPNDRLIFKLATHFIFFVELVQTIFSVADGFHRYVFGFGDMNRMDEMFLANFDTPIMDAVIASIVQGMYAWRVYKLSKLKFITAFIGFCSFTQAVGGITIGCLNQTLQRYSRWNLKWTPVQIIWTVSSAVADTAIAASMTWLLLRSRGGLDSGLIKRNTVVTKIVRLTIETNVASAAVAIVVCVMVISPNIAPPKQSYFLAPGYVLGKLYSNSFMAMLNNRTLIRQDLSKNQLQIADFNLSESGGPRHIDIGGGHPGSIALPTSSFSGVPIDVETPSKSLPLNDFQRVDSTEAM